MMSTQQFLWRGAPVRLSIQTAGKRQLVRSRLDNANRHQRRSAASGLCADLHVADGKSTTRSCWSRLGERLATPQAIYLYPLSALSPKVELPAGWHRHPKPCARNSRRLPACPYRGTTHQHGYGEQLPIESSGAWVGTRTPRDDGVAGHPLESARATVRCRRVSLQPISH